MAGYKDVVKKNRRLEILRTLKEDPGYETNQAILQNALGLLGLQASMDQVASDIFWLDEQGLVEMSEVGSIRLAKITQRGLDVANGLAQTPGVARPAPGE